ncbi:S1 family peptidase [Aquabacterium sp.]|uniref:S1 family peptidase n=1 Tax=Aquabacterium sp. TaxID=1872578 RepID=UPI002C15784A|nr:serine protease [Aquabacterium sp.]HSW06989.1 serine protease [Aquabacterium sp.]
MIRLPLLLLLGGLLCQPALAQPELAGHVSLGASVLRIEAPRVSGGYAFGSGVMVDVDKLITNCHVTREAREIHVVRGGMRWFAAGQAVNIDHDLCLLHVPGIQARAVPLGQGAELTVGQPLTAHGFTGGTVMQHSAGEVVALHRHDGAQVIQASNRFSSGASGGGLFDDQGRLVGILTFRLRGGAAHYFAAPVEWVRQLLETTTPEQFRPIKPFETEQLAYWQQPTNAQPQFLKAAVLQRDSRCADPATETRAADTGEPGHAAPAPPPCPPARH